MAEIKGKKIKLFSLSSSKELAKEIAKELKIEVGDCTVSRFADGEVSISINESVRGFSVYIVQSTNSPVNENYMELLVMVDALKRASAREIAVVMPYYGYSRQDRKAAPRQPISSKLMADLLQAAGVNRMICLDLHAPQIQGFFNIPIDNLLALPIFARYFDKKDNSNVVVVSPDHGGATRARKLAEALNTPIAIADKRRPKPNQAEICNLIGEVDGKDCIVIDDMIDTAGSISAVIKLLKQRGAKKVSACCSHALLSRNALDKLSESGVDELVITNSVEISKERLEKYPFVKVVSIAKLLAAGISNIVEDRAISGLFVYNRDEEL